MHLEIPEYAASVIAALENAGHEAYAVGGCVRDAMLGKEPNDWDVTTSARPDEVRRLFSFLYGFTAIPTGVAHGTVTVLSEGEHVEVTTYRIDGEYTDCRRPDSVEFCDNLSLDLARRDFTINAMAYSDKHGLVDLYGGTEDLNSGIIRCVGEPHKRFSEDALRILRALRFASVLGFTVEPQTKAAAHELSDTLSHVSKERIGAELTKLVCGKNAAGVIRENLRIIASVLRGFTEKRIDDVLISLERLQCGSVPLMFAALLAESSAESVADTLGDIRLDKRTVRLTSAIAGNRKIELDTKVAVKRLYRDMGAEATDGIIRLKMARGEVDGTPLMWLDEALLGGECMTLAKLAVNGNDLAALGISDRALGRCLERLLELVISDKLPNVKKDLLTAAEKMTI